MKYLATKAGGMKLFLEEILADIDWRTSELATLKSIYIKYSFGPDHKDLYIKYAVPAIYAIWEGFVKSCFTSYAQYLNSKGIRRSEISYPLLAHVIDSECDFNSPRTNFDSKRKLVEKLDTLLGETIDISTKVPTESNVNFKVLSKILERFCVQDVDRKYEQELDKLLFFRNTISHGENSLKVNSVNLQEFVSTVENLMLDVVLNIEQSDKIESFKK